MNIDVKMAILDPWTADDMCVQKVYLVNILLITKICISKFEYGTLHDIITMFHYELRFRRQHLATDSRDLL